MFDLRTVLPMLEQMLEGTAARLELVVERPEGELTYPPLVMPVSDLLATLARGGGDDGGLELVVEEEELEPGRRYRLRLDVEGDR